MPETRPHAAVIGAGIAGTLIAARLLRQGWCVSLYDSADGPFAQASGNPAGAFHAHLSRDDVPLSRLTRIGVQSTLYDLNRLTRSGWLTYGRDWNQSGHYQLFDSEADARRMTLALSSVEDRISPDECPREMSPAAIEQDLGIAPVQGGLLFEQAGWVNPAAWGTASIAEALNQPGFRFSPASGEAENLTGTSDMEMTHERQHPLQTPSEGCQRLGGGILRQQWRSQVVSIQPIADHVLIRWHDGADATRSHCHAFDRVVIAAGLNSLELFAQPGAHAQGVKGQISFWKTEQSLRRVISGAAYAIDLKQGYWLIGATFDRSAQDTTVTQAGHQWNVERIQAAFCDGLSGAVAGGRSAVRAMWPDRLPAIGPAVDVNAKVLDRVWFATGFGSRGLTWAALAANLIADDWAGQKPALPQDLLSAVLPGRFFSRASNSKPTFPSFPNTK